MPEELNSIEIRILASLAEKSFTLKEQYPLTFNSLLLSCNQKSSRSPIMQLDIGTLGKGIESLIEKGLMQKHLYSGERSVKYTHNLAALLNTADDRLHALFIVLMLRGPQTAAELKIRTERLYRFESAAQIEELFSNLIASQPEDLRILAKAPRRPGQKEARYMHLFCDMPEQIAETNKERECLVFKDKSELRLQVLEKQVAALEKWLSSFSNGAFVPYAEQGINEKAPASSSSCAGAGAEAEPPASSSACAGAEGCE